MWEYKYDHKEAINGREKACVGDRWLTYRLEKNRNSKRKT